MEQLLTYGLAPQPPPLFLDGAMKKPTKSALGNLSKSFVSIQANFPNTAPFVIDGGHLLQTVVWSQPSTGQCVSAMLLTYLSITALTAGTIVVMATQLCPPNQQSSYVGQKKQHQVTLFLTRTCKPLLVRQLFGKQSQ